MRGNDGLNSDVPASDVRVRRFWLRSFPAALGLVLLAAVTRGWIAPELERLPVDYAVETRYQTKSRARETPGGPWISTPLIGRRVDQTLVVAGDTAIVQADLHWSTAAGQVLFESSGIYGVERRTRRNVGGYGNFDRSGQFLFPPHIQLASYQLWDALYIGPRTAIFQRIEEMEGVKVYVFDFKVRDLDETAGYSHLADVPERFEAHSNTDGTLWVEPVSGVVVGYQERGVSYFFDGATKKRVADLFVWSDQFTPQTRAAQLKLALSARFRSRVFEFWVPLGLLLGGALCLVSGSRRRASDSSAVGAHLAVAGENL